jgi:hypothetical protein
VTGQKLERWAGILAVLNLAVIAILSGRPSFSNASRPVRGISNPVLAMEVVRNVQEVDAILSDAPSPDREAMRIKQYVDFAFIGAYGALFVLMSVLLMPEGRAAAIAAMILGVAGAIFDVIENLAILRVVDTSLDRTTQAAIDAIRYPSLVKWALASLTLVLLGILFARRRGIGARIVGGLDVIAGVLGLVGVYDNVFLMWAGIPTLGGLVGLAILFFRPNGRNRR